jgi:signal peptidase II
MKKKPYIIAFFFFIIDLLSKQLISHLLNVGDSIKVINNFFYITYVRNTGAAWSILEDQRILLLIISVFVLFLINKTMNKETLNKLECFSYGMIIGGIIGNIFDRVFYSFVIDFIDFRLFGYNYPVFNLADTFIVIGIIIMAIITIRKEYHERSNSRRK